MLPWLSITVLAFLIIIKDRNNQEEYQLFRLYDEMLLRARARPLAASGESA